MLITREKLEKNKGLIGVITIGYYAKIKPITD